MHTTHTRSVFRSGQHVAAILCDIHTVDWPRVASQHGVVAMGMVILVAIGNTHKHHVVHTLEWYHGESPLTNQ